MRALVLEEIKPSLGQNIHACVHWCVTRLRRQGLGIIKLNGRCQPRSPFVLYDTLHCISSNRSRVQDGGGDTAMRTAQFRVLFTIFSTI